MQHPERIDSHLVRIQRCEDQNAAATSLIKDLSDDETRSSASVDLQVASFLRLLAIDQDFVYKSVYRRRILRLLTERLQETNSPILTRYHLPPNAQADQICRRLSRVAPDAINSLSEVLEGYQGLHRLRAFRERLLGTLNSSLCRAVIRPFLDVGGDTIRIVNNCLSAVIEYLEADIANATSTYTFAENALLQAIEPYSQQPTHIGATLDSTLRTLYEDLQSHRANSPYMKPAIFDVKAGARRYPLHEQDLPLSLRIDLINIGDGTAADVEVQITNAIGLRDYHSPQRLSSVAPGSILVELEAKANPEDLDEGDVALCELSLTWVNNDGTAKTTQHSIALEPQDSTIQWEELTLSDPYSLEAVTTEADLVGRTIILNRVLSTLKTKSVGSVYIHGQKRVGKTSLARVALAILASKYDVTTIFLDIGTIVSADPSHTINNLVGRIATLIRQQLPVAETNLKADGSLVALNGFLEQAVGNGSNRRIVIALDEFDRLPLPLFQRTAQSDAFFLGLRSISAIQGVGIILIGGERMNIIINGPGVELNRFKPLRVDYIDRATHWPEFCALVQNPARGSLDYSGKALDLIYNYTEGNPYYTKLVCSRVLELAAQRRDSFVDDSEVESAVELLLGEIDPTSFSHYWEDFLLEEDDKRDEVTIHRRRTLLAYGLASAGDASAQMNDILSHATSLGLETTRTKEVLREFASRGLLTKDQTAIHPRILLFGRWIAGNGQEQITFTATESESALRLITERAQHRVTLQEASSLVQGWGSYRGRVITGEAVLSYLRQFGNTYHQRLVFHLLQNLHFIDTASEDQLLLDAYRHVEAAMRARHGEWGRSQIRVSFAGPTGKSSANMARRFASANRFLRDRRGIVPPSRLCKAAEEGVTDVVIVDDFVGSGDTLQDHLEELEGFVASNQVIHLFILAGMSNGVDAVNVKAFQLLGNDRIRLRCLNEYPNQPSPFDSESEIFPTVEMALDAQQLVEDFGKHLEPRVPFGYSNCSALVTFAHTIPNNALPILWSSGRKKFDFKPLFPRN